MCADIALLQPAVLPKLFGPCVIFEDTRGWAQGDARVDKGTAAEAASHKNVHVLAEAHVIEARRRARAHTFTGDLEFVF